MNLPHAVVILCNDEGVQATEQVGAEEEVKGTSFLLFGGYINSFQKQVLLFGTFIL